jgi:hypothetical protein
VKDWAKPPLDHVDPYHLDIRFVGFITAIFFVKIDFIAEIYLLEVVLLKSLLPEAICQHTSREVSDCIVLFQFFIGVFVGLRFVQINLQFHDRWFLGV